MEEASPEMELPGFRFHPTEEELVNFYLRNMLHGKKLRYDAIRFLNIYRHDPAELPRLARQGEREWYFYVPMAQKQGSSGGRPNRTTEKGYWKVTGSDRKIMCLTGHKRLIGLRKTLVFYRGRTPLGSKTNWVMNEYRVPDNSGSPKDMVLCKIYQKAISLKVLEQRAAVEGAVKISNQSSSSLSPLHPPALPFAPTQAYTPLETTSAYTWPHDVTLPFEATQAYTPLETTSAYTWPHDVTLPFEAIQAYTPLETTSAYTWPHDVTLPLEATPAYTPLETTSAYTWPQDVTLPASDYDEVVLKLEENMEEVFQIQTEEIGGPSGSSSRVSLQFGRESLPELHVPRFPVADWTQDGFWTQFNSPWQLNLIATLHERLELLG